MPEIRFTIPRIKSVYYTEVSQCVFNAAVDVASEINSGHITETFVEMYVSETLDYLSQYNNKDCDIKIKTLKNILDYVYEEDTDAILHLENKGE